MKSNFWNRTLSVTALCALTLPAWSAPLQRADVPADPAWVLHLDCDSLRPTAIGQFILGEMDKPESKAKLAAFQTIFSFDPRKQLHGLTLYGTGAKPEDGVLLVYADFDAERLTTLAKAAKKYESSEHGAHTIHSWIDENKKNKHGEKRVYASIQGNRVIFGQREATVASALDVLDGGANLSTTSTFPQLGATGTTSFIQGAARRLDLPGTDPNSQLLKLSKSIRLDVGEAQQQLIATITLEANDEEVAKNINSIAQGMVSLMKLQKDNPNAQKLADAITLKQDGAVTISTLSLPVGDAIAIMKADAARKAKKHAE
ncbi:hypothetical protein [Pedosphaera parvula]|uniref:Uncharacterized protein n=1 Tax=Pedosphaera parvula (strain Ellin514) TaxID=320771 RepID=B9XNH2_PEDPL|nr:hypothetical protein [Pedosphaera parvula]EEF58631.1 hypothetical protein Cflav_PD1532 [Pedosphaera parvula Ellin514]